MITAGENFIKKWYDLVDNKAEFSELEVLTIGTDLIVDFPGNQLDFEGFREWYKDQCSRYKGHHLLHSIDVSVETDQIIIQAEITWTAKIMQEVSEEITLYPNVTMKLVKCGYDDDYKVYYYGCIDRI